MVLRLEGKKAQVAELQEIASDAISAVAADYRGLTVAKMTELRTNARQKGVVMRVFRNTLARRALQDTTFACLDSALLGPIVLFFSYEEPGAAAKLIRDFIKENERLEVRALVVGSETYGPDQLQAIASLPSRDEALAQLLSVMKAPITKFVRTLAEPYAQVARVMSQVAEQKKSDI